MSEPGLLIGVAESDITPAAPIRLAGFAVRTSPFEAIDVLLKLRALWITRDGASCVLVTADILWWAPERSTVLRKEIADRWGIPDGHVILHATHTHGAPHASTAFPDSLGGADAGWIAALETALLETVASAWQHRQPGTVWIGRGETGIGINRRVLQGSDSEGEVDRELVVIQARATDGSVLMTLAHHACHPTTTNLPRVTADFPGVMARLVAARVGGIAGYLQGCCGDINPRPTAERAHRTLDHGDVTALGEELAGDVLAVLDVGLREVSVTGISVREHSITLPFRDVPAVTALEAQREAPGIDGEWARFLVDHPERLVKGKPLTFSLLYLGDDLGFLMIDAEVTTPYGMYIKARSGGSILPLPYSNGMTAYVITKSQLAAGGYEAEGSTPYFGLPSPFAAGIERHVTEAIDALIDAHPKD